MFIASLDGTFFLQLSMEMGKMDFLTDFSTEFSPVVVVVVVVALVGDARQESGGNGELLRVEVGDVGDGAREAVGLGEAGEARHVDACPPPTV